MEEAAGGVPPRKIPALRPPALRFRGAGIYQNSTGPSLVPNANGIGLWERICLVKAKGGRNSGRLFSQLVQSLEHTVCAGQSFFGH